jgi:hypothetical protein
MSLNDGSDWLNYPDTAECDRCGEDQRTTEHRHDQAFCPGYRHDCGGWLCDECAEAAGEAQDAELLHG